MEILIRHREALVKAMEQLLEVHPPPSRVLTMCRYHMGLATADGTPIQGGAGKMVRPALGLEVCEVLGGNVQQCLPAAISLELVHRTSLIFDDIQDRSPLRNHQPTVWGIWGSDQAINAGLTLSSYGRLALQGMLEAGASAELVLSVDQIMEQAVIELCRGQYMDLNFPQAPPTLEEYLEMVRLKTGALMGLSCEVGALVARQSSRHTMFSRFSRQEWLDMQKDVRLFGQVLGQAFQLQDDYLGVWGKEAEMGKEPHDLEDRKWGLPVVLAMQEEPEVAKLLAPSDKLHAVVTAQLRQLLEDLGIREKAQALVQEAAQTAALNSWGVPGANNRIMELVAFAAHRSV